MGKSKNVDLINFATLNPYEDISLRDYQKESKAKIYKMWGEKRSIMFQMPTGTGKTRLFVSIVQDLENWGLHHNREVKVLLLAHRIELIDQIGNELLNKYKIPYGLIASQNREHKSYAIQVGSVPTLNRRLPKWAGHDFDVVIVDEAHHVKADSYKRILKEYPTAKVLGVTATPYRMNHASFHPEFDDIIISKSIHEFIQEGYLSDYEYCSIKDTSSIQLAISGITRYALDGDYEDEAMLQIMDRDHIRANIVNTYLKFAKGKKGIVYTINKQHNLHVRNRYREAGLNAEAIDSNTSPEERDRIVSDFRRGKIDILCNVNIFSEGFDCPDVEFIQLARPTKSLAMYLQQVGRGLRTAKNKDKVVILDNVGLYNRFGFPSAMRQWRHHFEGREIFDYDLFSNEGIGEGRPIIRFDNIEEGDEETSLIYSSKSYDQKNDNLYLLKQLKIKEEEFNRAITEITKKIQGIDTAISNLKNVEIACPEELVKKRNLLELERQKIVIKNEIEKNVLHYFNGMGESSYSLQYNRDSGLVINS